MKTILLAGAGNIGFRHLECIIKANQISQQEILIDLFDINKESIAKLQSKISLSNNEKIKVRNNINDLSSDYNIIIVATTSRPRPEITNILSKKYKHATYILEKNLAENKVSINTFDCLGFISNNLDVFVNQWYWQTGMFDFISNNDKKIESIKIGGINWGMGCNSIHYIHLIENILKEKIVLEDSNLQKVSSKRDGYDEIIGHIYFKSLSGSEAVIECTKTTANSKTRIIQAYGNIEQIVSFDGKQIRNLTTSYSYDFKPLSSSMLNIYLQLLSGSSIEGLLPGIDESIRQHNLIFDAVENSIGTNYGFA